MSEFQKPYSSSVTEETYRRIFAPHLSCEGCFHSWRSKDSIPCKVCTRVPKALRVESIFDSDRVDYFTKCYKDTTA